MILYERRETVRTPDARSGVEANAERRPCGNLRPGRRPKVQPRGSGLHTRHDLAEDCGVRREVFPQGPARDYRVRPDQVDPYTDKDGNKRTHFEVVADEVEFAESRRAAEDQPAGSLAAGYMENESFAEIDGEDGELPF